ncbi:MAG TPA: LD-carboxypeptidase, partial [Vicinamibacteria bacterium]|nr:LD-carboxypeptidase [Vicinamibacteria bacterium]
MRGCQPAADAGYTLEEVVLEALAGLGPIAFGLPSGHVSSANVTVPLGVLARLDCSDGEARLAACEAAVR